MDNRKGSPCGIMHRYGGIATLTHCTFAGNRAMANAGGGMDQADFSVLQRALSGAAIP